MVGILFIIIHSVPLCCLVVYLCNISTGSKLNYITIIDNHK